MTRPDESARSGNDKVLAEHRALREILARMREATSRSDLVSGVAEFLTAARDHFAGEERDGGFFESVVLTAPRHQAVLHELQTEHQQFLREADGLAARARDCDDQDLGCVRDAVTALADRLDEHEAIENEILLEVMNTDLGAGD